MQAFLKEIKRQIFILLTYRVDLQCVNFWCSANDSVCVCIPFPIRFHCGLSEDAEWPSLCYTAEPRCSPVLCMTVCVCSSQPPAPSLPASPHPRRGNCMSVLCSCESVCSTDKFMCVVFYIPHIRDIIGINIVFLLLTDFPWCDSLQVHLHTCKWHVILSRG